MQKINRSKRFFTLIIIMSFISQIIPIPKAFADIKPNKQMKQVEESYTYQPEEKETGLVKNPAMGWVLYLDAFNLNNSYF